MDIISLIAPMILMIFGYTVGSTKMITQGNQALVERLGKYHRTLKPGLNFIIPFVDKIAVQETTREQILDIKPQSAITKNNVSLEVDVIIYWRVLDLEKIYYQVENFEDVEDAISNLFETTLYSAIGSQELDKTYLSTDKIKKTLLEEFNQAAESWGVKVVRIEVQDFKPQDSIMDSFMESLEKQASISRTPIQ